MKKLFILSLSILVSLCACTDDFLDKKPDKSLLVPTTLTDLRALLDNSTDMNAAPYLGLLSSDDCYTTDAGYTSANALIQGTYSWMKDPFQGTVTITDWNKPYQQIFYSNVVLDGLHKIIPNENDRLLHQELKGSALFFRALAYYRLAQEFIAPYDPASLNEAAGVPIKTTSDVNVSPGRGTVKQTYDQIVRDLTEAIDLMPDQAFIKTRPSKIAALGLAARVYLVMGNYPEAANLASRSLMINDKLLNYNTLNATAANPMPRPLPSANDEVSFYSVFTAVGFFISAATTSVDSTLYKSYSNNDLRRSLFFNNRGNNIVSFKGSYTGAADPFAGTANDEIYLIRAECQARLGNFQQAMNDVNTLLRSRYRTGTFTDMTAKDANEALSIILQERRKELVFREHRWSDLRRLNLDPRFATTIKRVLKGVEITLSARDARYILPIPDSELAAGVIQQNPR